MINYIMGRCCDGFLSKRRQWPSNLANTGRCINVGFMLDHRRRRWAGIKPTLGQRLVSPELDSAVVSGGSIGATLG